MITRAARIFPAFLIGLILLTISANAQILKPATWSHKASQNQVKVGDEIDLIFLVDIDQDWYLYSSDFDPDLGPMVTEFTFEPSKNYELVGDIKPVGAKEKYDDLWEGTYTYFTKKAEFRQTIKVLNADLKAVSGTYNYQVCTDVDGRCIPFDDEFTIKINTLASNNAKPANTEQQITKTRENKSDQETSVASADTATIQQTLEKNKLAEKDQVKVDKSTTPDNPTEALTKASETATLDSYSPYSLATFFFIAFLAGLAALLTPCVFPMIPMTVSFFTNSSASRSQAITKALVYGISIVVIYTLAGVIVSAAFGPAFANWLSTHWLPNLFFFAVFVIFALSFFGLFEITLPSSFVNNVDQKADKGGFIGTFFMAFTLVLVSFSCTGPIVGSLLVEAAGGHYLKPVLGMMGFSLAFAVPFTLFAIFPEWLSSLPKSGGWLNSVKVILGFLELALALKFLSVADQVYHWNILDREIYLAFWIVIFTLMGFYLLGKIRLAHDSKMESVGVFRLMLAIATFSFVMYLIPGMFGAPLKRLAGYLPPMYTHDFNVPSLIAQKISENPVLLAQNNEKSELCGPPKYADLLHFPHEIKGYFDYDQAIACAKAENKPVFIDFTGHGCVNCREMEARVWSDPEVLKRLKTDFVMVALYVDEKKQLPEKEWYTSEYDGKVKKTMGNQNADFQITEFNNNAQPFYVLVDPSGKLLAKPKAYDLDVQEFINFLDLGKQRFAKGESIDKSSLANN